MGHRGSDRKAAARLGVHASACFGAWAQSANTAFFLASAPRNQSPLTVLIYFEQLLVQWERTARQRAVLSSLIPNRPTREAERAREPSELRRFT